VSRQAASAIDSPPPLTPQATEPVETVTGPATDLGATPSTADPEADPSLEPAGNPAGLAVDDLPVSPHAPAGEPGCWDVFAQYQADGQLVQLEVEGYNRGGLLVRWKGVLGFVPASQLCDGLRYGDERSRLEDLSTRVGTSLTLRVIEVDATKNRLIFSERAARHIEDPDLAVLDEINDGDVCRGYITNLCTFGAFVDLGGIEGLIHISELSWGRVAHPSDVLQSGQEVEVYVLNVDRGQGRVGLSLKRLQPDPWDRVEERYAVDQIVQGTVTNVVNFGAFVRLEEGLEGLIHASELTGEMMPSLHTLREGENITVRINSIEGGRHRIGLSLESL
jgi:small subunit ribosomal protein S1